MAKGLGRGLSALFSDTEEAYENARTEVGENALSGATEVEVSEIFPNPHQPRKAFDENAMNDLANSIREHGIISPLVVNKNKDGTYTVFLRILAPAQPMLELKFVVPDRKTAQNIYKKWELKAADVYAVIYENLVD